MSIGAKIANARKQQNLTQEQLAEFMGVTRQSVSRWESDAAFPEMDKIVKLANVLDISCDYLLKDDIQENGTPKSNNPVTRLLSNAIGKDVVIQAHEEESSVSYKCIIKEFEASWANIVIFKGKKTEEKLLPISSITSITFLKEKE